jgi:hypothetical protein
MPDYRFFIKDERYSVPTLSFVSAVDLRRARELAEQRLLESAHHISIEVWNDEGLLFSVERPTR